MSRDIGVLDEANDIVWPRALLLTLAIATVLVVGVLTATSTASFSPYNPSWDGSTALRERIEDDPGVDGELVRDPDRYGAFTDESVANETVAFVIAPDEPYTDDEAAQIEAFVENGGTLVVLESFGEHGNTLLADVGATARADGRIVRDDYRNGGGPAMPVAPNVTNHSLTDGVDRLTLNYATAIDPGSANTTVLATTSDVAYLTAEDDPLENGDELGAYPVATVESVGRGRVVTIGDPSIVINAMMERSDNGRFVRELYADEEHVLLDASHVTDPPPLAAAMLTVRSVEPLQPLLGVAGIAAIAVCFGRFGRSIRMRGRRLWPGIRDGSGGLERRGRDPNPSDAERAAALRERHPDWDEDRIQRVIADGKRNWPRRDDVE
ncbi:DUF4350 domain-containing protein [Natrinema sp. 74]|uniref:DUF4350 domain-containing protein n=1 Tax=Natrinema sp. 74 TaxID=3384159 RepID=UPI0038D5122C